MKKFKKFYINLPTNKHLIDVVKSHIEHLGYKKHFCGDDYDFVTTYSDGDYQICTGEKNGEQITLDEFFRLAPDDVIVEPEKVLFVFKTASNENGNIFYKKEWLTQSQIDEITAIMERES